MRLLLLLVILIPIASVSQINRSAREFAMENVQEYLKTKIFSGRAYESLSFGPIKSCQEGNPEIAWVIENRFGITSDKKAGNKNETAKESGKVWLYLDSKMKVLRAEMFEIY